VLIPEGLGDGCPAWGCDYILSFRMDSEQTPEVWTNCAGTPMHAAPPAAPHGATPS
jgi:hypothetical protein